MDLLGEKSASQLASANPHKYFIQEIKDMNFTKQIFNKATMALPDITTRTFSRYCGKSEGYYGSISSQNLPISTHSLLYLSEVLEHKKAKSQNKHIFELQLMIAEEVARRMQSLETQNMAVRKMVIRAIAQTYMAAGREFSAPPIVIG
jgi:hypothetical protein